MKEDQDASLDQLVYELKERAKELNCLYEIQALLNNPANSLEEVFNGIIEAIPPGWQYPDICQVKILHRGTVFQSRNFIETPWNQRVDIIVQEQIVGEIVVSYTEEKPSVSEGPFLREERRLITTIADQVGNFLLNRRLKDLFEKQITTDTVHETGWKAIIELLRRTDQNLLIKLSQKMINYLCWIDVKEAEVFLSYLSPAYREEMVSHSDNVPYQVTLDTDVLEVSNRVFEIARDYLSDDEIFEHIQQWIREDQSSFLVEVLVSPGSSLLEIRSAFEKYDQLSQQGLKLLKPRAKSVLASLIRRVLSDNTSFLRVAQKHIDVNDFRSLLERLIFSSGSHGKLGGKGSGLFLASQILKSTEENRELLNEIKIPRTYYIASDIIFSFMGYNDLDGFIERKYVDINLVKQEYPYVVHVFKNSPFLPDIVKELSLVLDDFGDVPLIVRSSSLLEDQAGMSFAGKYKSLFIPNQGSKEKKINELIDAIAEVYASMFGPDPIEYRLSHGLIDQHEEMGILIQEVVGKKIGPYYFPIYAGVAFSHNEYRWSSRIKKSDGLVRIVPGLGTRAVDRVSDDFPILVSPGQPGLRVNISTDEVIRYSPKMMDVINLETGSFETVNILEVLRNYGEEIPNIKHLISIATRDSIKQPLSNMINFGDENLIITFEGLLSRTPFLKQVNSLLTTLEEEIETPIDVEFASDGDNLYLLQCRTQSFSEDRKPAEIPRNIDQDDILFSAKKNISNGIITDINYIVYVDPNSYSEITDRQTLINIGRAVSLLNKLLPKKQFILMGPGRWGSRGDIKLGVKVTYSDINNTAALIEIAIADGDYIPELSFGTHFFQDLIEASIHYLPLYPDDYGIIFNYEFLFSSVNQLGKLIPNFTDLSPYIRVIDIPQAADGGTLQILMNSDISEAVAVICHRIDEHQEEMANVFQSKEKTSQDHWRWRQKIAEIISNNLYPGKFGVYGLYLFGSTKNATAGPKSDIDILIHFKGTEAQKRELMIWLDGWNISLSHYNRLRTGHSVDHLLDIHLVTDEDIQNKDSYAVKIGAVNDPARPLRMGEQPKDN